MDIFDLDSGAIVVKDFTQFKQMYRLQHGKPKEILELAQNGIYLALKVLCDDFSRTIKVLDKYYLVRHGALEGRFKDLLKAKQALANFERVNLERML